jgi:hypothetical protein
MEKQYAQSGQEFNGAFIGAILGDGSLSNSKNPAFLMGHKLDHQEYLIWKKDFFAPYLGEGTLRQRLHRGGGAKDRWAVHWWTKGLSKLRYHRQDFYPNGKKIVKRSVLNRLSPLGLAIWFADDGYVYHDITPNGTRVFKGIVICTNNFDDQSIETIRNWFRDQMGMNFSKDKRNAIHSDAPSGWRFLSIVKPYLDRIYCMHYKVNYVDRIDTEKSRTFQQLPEHILDRLRGIDHSTPVRGFLWQIFPKARYGSNHYR